MSKKGSGFLYLFQFLLHYSVFFEPKVFRKIIFVRKIIDINEIKLYNKVAFDLEVYYIMKRTYQPNNRKKAKKHGFFARIKGNVLKSRRNKKRKKLCA